VNERGPGDPTALAIIETVGERPAQIVECDSAMLPGDHEEQVSQDPAENLPQSAGE
jgi:hypothetical protein